MSAAAYTYACICTSDQLMVASCTSMHASAVWRTPSSEPPLAQLHVQPAAALQVAGHQAWRPCATLPDTALKALQLCS